MKINDEAVRLAFKKRYAWKPKWYHAAMGVLFWLSMMFCIGMSW